MAPQQKAPDMRAARSLHESGEKESPVFVKDLRSLRILLVQPKISEGAALKSHLVRIGCRVNEVWPPPPDYDEDIDVVFVMVDKVIEDNETFQWNASAPPAVLIAVIDYESPLAIDRLLRMRANAVIGLPIRPFGILTNLLVTVNNYRREQKLRSALGRMAAKLETCRTVERAKLAMMLTSNRSEKEAYDRLRRLAMERRTTVDVVSEEILGVLDWNDNEALSFLSELRDSECSSS